jgi:hypothetical protein
MGCGCGRKINTRANRMKKLSSKKSKIKRAKLQSNVAQAVVSPLTAKTSICIGCPESKQTKEERKRGIRICHKCNRLINNITRDAGFKCPLGKWAKN